MPGMERNRAAPSPREPREARRHVEFAATSGNHDIMAPMPLKSQCPPCFDPSQRGGAMVQSWVFTMNVFFDVNYVESDAAKIRYAFSLLRGPAMDWWSSRSWRSTEPGGAEPGGAGSARVASRGASSRREVLSPQELREWFARRWGPAAGAGGTPAATGSGGTCPGGAGAAGPGGTAEAAGVGPPGGSAGASDGPGAAGSAGPGAAGATRVGAAGGVGAGGSAAAGTSEGAGAGAAGAGAVGAGATVGLT
ncbi:unnamed protein product [Closterium sp. NIES-53]